MIFKEKLMFNYEERKMLPEENDLDKNIEFHKEILKHIFEILTLFRLLIDKMIKMEGANEFKKEGTFNRTTYLFGKISDLYKEIEHKFSPSNTFLENLGKYGSTF
jgi:hypothetical protein